MKAVQLKRGHSKDHRPDLKQIVFGLSVTADGAVPIHFKSYDGNTTDDTTHQESWTTLRGLTGRSDFVYVADSNLCTEDNLRFIDVNQGSFITIVPRTPLKLGGLKKRHLLETLDGESFGKRQTLEKNQKRTITKLLKAFISYARVIEFSGITPPRRLSETPRLEMI